MNISKTNITWDEVSKAEGGKVFLDTFDDGVRFIIMKGGSSLCAYLGIPEQHPLAGFDYDSIPINAHGGLTFSGNGNQWPDGYYFYGWDYAHSGDYCDYYDREPLKERYIFSTDKKWTVDDVVADSWTAIYEFKSIMKLAESIYNNATIKKQPTNSPCE